MKIIFTFVFLLVALTQARVNAKDPIAEVLPANYGEVVFVRQESFGSLNILLSTVMCDEWPRVVLVGGEAGSVYLKEGKYTFQVFSAEPYEPDSPATACQSAPLRVEVQKGKKAYIEVIPNPGDEKTRIKFSWTLKEKRG